MVLRSVASRLALWVLAGSAVVLVAAGTLLFRLVGQQVLEHSQREAAALASDAGHRIQQRLDRAVGMSQVLAAIIGAQPTEARPLIQDAMQRNPDLAGLAAAFVPDMAAQAALESPFVSRQDNGLLTTRDLLRDPVPYVNTPWFRQGLTCTEGCWGQAFYSMSRHRKLVNYSSAILRGGVAIGAVNADVTLNWLGGLLHALNKPAGAYAFVLDDKDEYLAHDDPQRVGQYADSALLESLRLSHGAPLRLAAAQNPQGQAMWIYHAPIAGTRWQFGLAVPEAQIYADVRQAFLTVLGMGLVALLALTAVTLVIIRRIMAPLKGLTEGAEQVARGDLEFVLPPPRRQDEIGRLTHAFDRMRDELARHIERLTQAAREQQRLASELEIAHQIQIALLPGPHYLDARCSNFELHAVLKPARAVGGDLYSYFMLDEQRFYVMVGDVSDKGIPAALFMARTVTLAKSLAAHAETPEQLLLMLNRELCRNNESCMFVSLLCGLLDTTNGDLVMASAGHEPPVLWGKQAPQLLQLDTGPALGLHEDAAYSSYRLRLLPGETLLMHTDGITEATNNALEMYGQERMLACLGRQAENGEIDPASGLLADVEAFADGAAQADDITVLALQWHRSGRGDHRSLADLRCDASLSAVSKMLEHCDIVLFEAGFKADLRQDVRLVLEELMVNIVQHGHAASANDGMRLHLRLVADALVIELDSGGPPFDPLQSPSPLLTGDLADREQVGGLGIHLVRAVAGHVSYFHDEQGNHLLLRFTPLRPDGARP